ncbi:MAG: transcription antitermination factor NusB [Chloroflexi bacterium]|nr:transcription antitermination factor NusB [Chloroflexota bacterium]
MPGVRHTARIIALQALFESDATRKPAQAALERLLQQAAVLEEASAVAQKLGAYPLERSLERQLAQLRQAEPYAREIVKGVSEQRSEIDGVIARYAPVRPVKDLFAIDRAILRIAIFEILSDNRAAPKKVAVDEAVELAKLFGSDASSRFVNGVLGGLLRERHTDARPL